MEYIFDRNNRIVHTSVREICEFLYRTGDVYSGGTDIAGNAMLEGAKIHRKLQAEYKKNNKEYQSEFHINYSEEIEDFTYELAGSIDGILEKGDATVIDEFKTTRLHLEDLQWDTVKAYSAQIMCYGYIYAHNNSLNFVTLRLTYYNCDSDDVKTIEKEYTFTELRTWFEKMLCEHLKWAKLVYNHKIKRDESLKELAFPFGNFRQGQRTLSGEVYRSIRDNRRLFAQAPTGIGKTVSTLFPSLKALGEGQAEKIFYLSAKNSGAVSATDCLDACINKGAEINYTAMTSKEKICPNNKNCLPSECEYSKGHYDRVNDALYELVSTTDKITKEKLYEMSEKHKVCPFELQLDASEYCDVVVGDYNYVFDPKARLRRYFSVEGNYVTLVDEAHNLVDRAREMYSSRISYFQIKSYSKHFKGIRKLTGKLNKCCALLQKISDGLKIDGKNEKKIVLSENDLSPFRSFCDAYRKFLTEDGREDVKKKTLQLYFDISFFVEIFDVESVFQEDYADYCGLDGEDCYVKLFCANPSNQITMASKLMKSTVFFSATMTPYEYYIKMLGADEEDDKIITLPSPFDHDKFDVCLFKDVSTRYKDRNHSVEKVCNIIYSSISSKTGNYLVFFPSYGYMELVYSEFSVMHPDVVTVIQTKEMTNEERIDFLNLFCENTEKTLVGFVLCGGVFSEGVDLTGERLSGAVIVGTGLPQVCFERDLLKKHFDDIVGEGMGYNYAYTYTGLNRVYQAAGRVIRTAKDVGFVVLADDRFAKMSHRKTFPESWDNIKYVSDENMLNSELVSFWNKQKN